MWYDFLRIILIVVAIYFLIKTVKIVRIILTIVLGVVYIPINNLNIANQKMYFNMKKHDIVLYYLYTPFYWLLVAITFIISLPYDFLITEDIH